MTELLLTCKKEELRQNSAEVREEFKKSEIADGNRATRQRQI